MSDATTDSWFHALRFPDGTVTPGRFDRDAPPNYTLWGALALLRHLDLAAADCLDIGTMDGLMAFSLARAGARSVSATDVVPRPTFERARAALGLDVAYRTPFLVSDVADAPEPSWDLIACCGVLYHVFDPLPLLVTLRRNLRPQGWLILETQYLKGEGRSRLSFEPGEAGKALRHANTFFRPSHSALCALMETAGFEVVTTIATLGRLTVLARAERPSAIRTRTAATRKVLDRYRHYANYREAVDHAGLDAASARGVVGYAGPVGDFVLDTTTRRPASDLEPEWRPSAAARARYRLRDRTAWLAASIARRRLLPHWP
jgi:SAM-dependent methyltransferase